MSEPVFAPPSEGFSYAQICELLGFNPSETRALTITENTVVAVSNTYIEPVEVTDGE